MMRDSRDGVRNKGPGVCRESHIIIIIIISMIIIIMLIIIMMILIMIIIITTIIILLLLLINDTNINTNNTTTNTNKNNTIIIAWPMLKWNKGPGVWGESHFFHLSIGHATIVFSICISSIISVSIVISM